MELTRPTLQTSAKNRGANWLGARSAPGAGVALRELDNIFSRGTRKKPADGRKARAAN
jgi:hypothetical protein